MKKVNWKWEYGVYVPFCPYCDEVAYEKDRCVFCGKDYEWVDGEYDETIVCVGEYTGVQCTNNHIHIYKGDTIVLHSLYNRKVTEDELRDMVAQHKKAQDDLVNDDEERSDG